MIKFKSPIDSKLLLHLHPLVLVVLFDAQFFLKHNYDYDITVTATLSDVINDKKIGRKSSTHREGRAIDIRLRDMGKDTLRSLVRYLNNKYENIAATSKSTGKPTIIVIESDHIHLQIHKRYSMKEVESFSSLADKH